MMKATLAIVLLIFLSPVTLWALDYDRELLSANLMDREQVMMLSSIEGLAYIDYHSGSKEADHISFYATAHFFIMSVEGELRRVVRDVCFIKENWTLKGSTWTILRYVDWDLDTDGNIDQTSCSSVINNKSSKDWDCELKPGVITKEVMDKVIKTGMKL